MATGGGPSIEDEEQNFTRIQIVLSDCGIAVLKELFMQRVRDLSPDQPNGCWTVDEFLNENMNNILRSIGNDTHKKRILYPFRQNTDLDKWDVPLFVHVLLASCDISAAGGTLRHDITNLSSLRKKLRYTPHPKLAAGIYNGYLGRVRGSINRICVFLNNQTLTQFVNETLDKYESLTHAYPNGKLEEHVKNIDIVSEDDLAVTGALEQIEQLINERGTRIQIPVIEVVLLLRHYNREDEERVSNYLRELFANAVQQSTLQEEASQAVADPDREGRGEQGDRDRDVADIVNHLVQELFREKRKVTYAKQRCVILGIQVPDIGSAITLIDDIISGRMYSLFAPLEEMMRTQKGHELFDIYVTIERKTTYTFLNEIVSQITSSRSLSQKMTLSVKQDDVCTDAVRCVYHPSSYIERGQVINDLISKEKSELYQTTVDEIRRVLEIPKLEMNVFIDDTSCPKSVVLSVDKTFPVTQSTLTWLEWALRGLKALPIWKAIGLDFTGELDVDSLRSKKITENSKTPVNIKQEIAEEALKARFVDGVVEFD